MPYEFEKSLENFGNFCFVAKKELEKISESLDNEGSIEIDPQLPVFVNSVDFMNTKIDPFDLDIPEEDEKLRNTILSIRQIVSELEKESYRII